MELEILTLRLMPGMLYIVATPIGNLEDITLRALRILKEVDAVLCEDTRVTRKLLDHYRITKPVYPYFQHSGPGVSEKILSMLEDGKTLALVTDAGTPGISDPGNKLIAQVIGQLGSDAKIMPIPGVSAVTALASVAGFGTDKFCFLGYPPAKKGRQAFFKKVAQSEVPVILFESPHRIVKTLRELQEVVGGDRRIVVGRELTKKFETVIRGALPQVRKILESTKARGEFTIIIDPKGKSGDKAPENSY